MKHQISASLYLFLLLGASAVFLIACSTTSETPTPVPTSVATATPTTPALTPTLTPTLTAIQTPTPVATPTAPIVKKQESLFDVLAKPLASEAQKRRDRRAGRDPGYYKRVDRQLNEGRINFLLFGYGETHEPPVTERAYIGSQTIISYDTRTRQADIVSITHDTRAPEIERKLGIAGKPGCATRIDQAYRIGGFDLMGLVLEDATGLAMDFQVSFDDVVIQEFVDNVYGGVEVTVPMSFQVHPFYLKGKKYPAGQFAQGRQKLNGTQVIQFIKTVPVAQVAYDTSLEHNLRKHLVFEALLDALKIKSNDPRFWFSMTRFLSGEVSSGAITYDFDPNTMAKDQIGNVVFDLGRYMTQDSKSDGSFMPRINKKVYIVDRKQGDGGIRWVDPNVLDDAFMQADIQAQVYGNFDMEVPYFGNPYAPDLASGYWASTRTLVKSSLLGIQLNDRNGNIPE